MDGNEIKKHVYKNTFANYIRLEMCSQWPDNAKLN